MPELPEVTTTVKGLQKVLPGLVFVDVWTDLAKKNQKIKQFEDTIKNEKFFIEFKKKIIGEKVIKIERKAKNILIHLSNDYTILIHLKMTGHLLFGEYKKVVSSKKKVLRITNWVPKNKGPLNDPYNRFIHVVFTFSNGKHLAFCDARKFGKVTLIPTHTLDTNPHLKDIGPEPLDKSFLFNNFKTRLFLKNKWYIKTVLMNQSIIAGIGNIYSDEMLWLSDINPESKPEKVPEKELLKLFNSMKEVLQKGIDFGGDSMSDYRNIDGLPGDFQNHHNVYKKKNTKCVKKNCGGVIIRKVINGRSAHFCNKHQKLF
jgi:formamidopyrimidine-DNA glycosylase